MLKIVDRKKGYIIVENNIQKLKTSMEEAAKKANRDEDIKLITVSKTRTIEEIKKVASLGLTEFGENRAQEFERKYDKIADGVNWHFVGHMQRNKVRFIVGKVSLIHSVDSIRLAKAINKEAEKQEVVQDILLQFNIAKEESKFGFYEEDIEEIIKEIKKLDHINVIGLMTMAPHTENPEDTRPTFKALRELSVDINKRKIDNMIVRELSMGMTNDYKIAIEEGSTMIRVGTAIFGQRNYMNS